MPDRRRRTAFRPPLPLPAPSSPLLRDHRPPTGPSSSPSSDDNPFAAPPEGRPDRAWQPRRPSHGGNGSSDGNGGDDGNGDAPEGGSSDDRPVWGGQWSSHQPGRQSGGFGGRPGPNGQNGQNKQGGPGAPEGKPSGLRWDPTDPAQRRARYALLCGMWAFFFALFDFPEIALLLGALALYWSISALRAKPKDPAAKAAPAGAPEASAPATVPVPPAGVPGAGAGQPSGAGSAPHVQGSSRQQTTAAVSGLVTALLALSIVATTFTVQLVYRDYYTCVNDALTKSGQLACNDLLPKPLEPFFGVKK